MDLISASKCLAAPGPPSEPILPKETEATWGLPSQREVSGSGVGVGNSLSKAVVVGCCVYSSEVPSMLGTQTAPTHTLRARGKEGLIWGDEAEPQGAPV